MIAFVFSNTCDNFSRILKTDALNTLLVSCGQIAQARRKTETAKDLEGIDMSNIVAGSRRRRRSEEDTSPPKKKRRSVESSDSESSEEESRSEEDSEEEFELSA